MQQPSRPASQLQQRAKVVLVCGDVGGGGSLSLFKDPIHSDLLKVLILILLSLQAFGNGG